MKWRVLLALVSLTIVMVHIALAPPKRKSRLELIIDLPDSLMELITSSIVAFQVRHVVIMVYDFVRARYWQGKFYGSRCNSIIIEVP